MATKAVSSSFQVGSKQVDLTEVEHGMVVGTRCMDGGGMESCSSRGIGFQEGWALEILMSSAVAMVIQAALYAGAPYPTLTLHPRNTT